MLDRVNISGSTLAPDGVTNPDRLARCLFFIPRSRNNGGPK
jgi:hypothetical protein